MNTNENIIYSLKRSSTTDLHLRAELGRSCAVKYPFGLNRKLLQHCYVRKKRLRHITNDLWGAAMVYNSLKYRNKYICKMI